MSAALPGAPIGRPFSAALLKRIALVWLLVALLQLAINAGRIGAMRFPDADDALRLQQVRDWLAGQGWFDLHQYRIAAPGGVPMHWSRLVDLPVAAVILLLRPLLGQPVAEMIALIAVPLLTLLCAMVLVGRLVGKLFDTETAGLACLLTGLAGPVIFQMVPMRIDHHAWQMVLALLAFNGLASRDPRAGGWVAGLAMAASLAISLEGLPLAAVFAAVMAVRLMRGPASSGWLVHFTAALASGSAVLFLATRGLSDLANHCDSTSPVHLAVLAWGALGCAALPLLRRRPPAMTLVAMGAIGAAALGIVFALAPQCAGGAFAELDPVVRKYWYNAITEGLPVWTMDPPTLVAMVAFPLFGVIAALRLWHRASDPVARAWWLDVALLVGGAMLIGILVSRASGTAALLAAIPAGWQLRERMDAAREYRTLGGRIGGLGLVVLLLMPSLPVQAWMALPLPGRDAAAQASAPSRCDYRAFAAALDRLPPTDVFAGLDMGPMILTGSHHRVIATAHHRANLAMRDVIEGFMGTPAQAEAIIRRRHATIVAVCLDSGEAGVYRRHAPHGLMADLIAGHPPIWLEPLDIAPASGIKAWRVIAPR